jgi:hypothetical protein
MLVAIAGVVAVYFVVLPVGLAIVVNHKARSPVERADLGAAYRRVTLGTSDGLTLAGWYVPSRNRAAVIVFPGRKGPVAQTRMLTRHGYGVLMLDRRGEGESEGDYNARGWGGEPDLKAAVSYLARRPEVDAERIGGLGLSVGGELLLQTAARDGRLRAVVSEGAGTQSLNDQMQIPEVPKALRWLSPMTVETAAGIVLANRAAATWPRGIDAADRAPAGAADQRRQGEPGRGAQPRLSRRGRAHGLALGDPAGRAHRRARRRAGRLRAPGGRIPRSGAARPLAPGTAGRSAHRRHVQAVVAIVYDDGVGAASGSDSPRGALGFRGVLVDARRLDVSRGVHQPPAVAGNDMDGRELGR